MRKPAGMNELFHINLMSFMKELCSTRSSLPSVAGLMWLIYSGLAPSTVKNFLPSARKTVLSF